MKQNVQKLNEISNKNSRLIIGLMSGTSLDGLDIALCKIEGSGKNLKLEIINFETFEYQNDFKESIKKVFAKRDIDFHHLALLNEKIGIYHAKLVLEALKKWNTSPEIIDLIASHGQTVMHLPKSLNNNDEPNATLQIGDGDHIAVTTGIITISDFRQKHIASGGEGAPLAVYGDYFLFSAPFENRIMLNIGGISNFTFLPKNQNSDTVFVTDAGPGNTLIDRFIKHNFSNLAFDEDAKIAKQGTINLDLLTALKSDEFFKKPLPKSTGPELFNFEYVIEAQTQSNTKDISVFDLLATLTRFSAETISECIIESLKNLAINPSETCVYASGGGVHNPLLMNYLEELLPYKIKTTNDLNILGDAKEAVLFGILANETICGTDIHFKKNPSIPSVSMGKISFPS